MNATNKKICWVRRPEQWAVFESPVRIEIATFLELLGDCSIAELGKWMERSPDTLYHHIRKLQAAGILVQKGWRKVGKQTEAIYGLVAPIRFDYDPKTGRNAEGFQRLTSAILRNADRDFKAATDGDGVVMEGRHKNLWIRQETVRLSKSALAEVNQHLREIMRILRESRQSRNGQLHSWTTVLVPLSRSPRQSKPSCKRQKKGADRRVRHRPLKKGDE